ncbi:hypothetical protein NQ317_009193 [Molorchus minor]|uniref:Chitin-binding type-2 domain-containing protein n=1 Tax=Molorchus minor TaxID=1323400 RepID=A0ABQ9JPD4_9CUCU|nr:hypothetical protein NQ317_009193 [Molorchus minor]
MLVLHYTHARVHGNTYYATFDGDHFFLLLPRDTTLRADRSRTRNSVKPQLPTQQVLPPNKEHFRFFVEGKQVKCLAEIPTRDESEYTECSSEPSRTDNDCWFACSWNFFEMRFLIATVLALLAVVGVGAKNCPPRKSNSKLFCYYGKLTDVDNCFCSHAILPANSDVKTVERAREFLRGVKVLVTVNEFNQGLVDLLKTSKIDGLEINLQKLDSKHDIADFISTIRSKLGSDLYLAVSVPSKPEIVAKYFDFKGLSKHADVFILQTAFLGASQNVTFHPSRLSGLWDMQNTDSVVDLVTGLGAPLSKLAITAPVQAFQFKLQHEEYTAPGSPAVALETLTRDQLCNLMSGGANWTLERDQDQAGPYIFSKDRWVAFEDSTSMDIKAKYSRVRGLAGLALKDVSQDGGGECGPSILEAAHIGLSRQARAPRGAVLHSLEREILETARPLDRVQVSPYRISRIIDVEGKIHAVRQDTRTEFSCSRQGYFVHPRSCNRFYRCVKFDQLVDDFNVFEFDCPAGLAFDERVEVCVWPGSLAKGAPCSGSSEIAPVPRKGSPVHRNQEEGYYADPENCRWFFACLDHGKSPLSAYEFRCPFGLVFDSDRLLCEWSWLVPKCSHGDGLGLNLPSEFAYGGYSSGHGAGVILQQYNGLGALGSVKLGGIAGKVTHPIVYSNVGTSGVGYQNSGYLNQGGYIVRNDLGGLGSNAVGSLQRAGLLRTDLGHGQIYQGSGRIDLGNNIGTGEGASNLNLQYNSGLGAATLQSGYEGAAGSLGLGNVNLAGGFGAKTSGQGQYQFNAASGIAGGSFGAQYHGASGQIGLDGQGGLSNLHQANVEGVAGDNVEGKIGLGYQGSSIGLQHQANVGEGSSGLHQSLGAIASLGGRSGQLYSQYQNQLGQGGEGTLSNIGLVQGVDVNGYQAGIDESANNYNFGLKSGQVYLQSQEGTVPEQNGVRLQSNALDNSGAKSYQTITQHHNQAQQILVPGPGQEGQLAYNAANANSFGARITPQNSIQHTQQNQLVAVDAGQNDVNYNAVNAQDFGVDSSQNLNQYQGEGVSGNINIVGGGYSAVGASRSGVEIQNNGANIDAIVHSTPAPISIATVSSIPTVTSVPIPKLKTASGFESYKGGVIANVPELQYRVYDNSTNFVKFVSTTPSALLVNEGLQERPYQNGNAAASYSYQSIHTPINKGYTYSKPSLAFEEGPTKTINQASLIGYNYVGSSTVRPDVAVIQANAVPSATVENSGGYVYSKPSITFEETPVKTISSFSISTPTTVRPVVVQQKLQPVVQPAVSYSFHRQEATGQKSIIFGEKQPQFVVSSTPQPVAIEQRPSIIVSSTTAPIIEQKISQPVIPSYTITQQIGSQGYNYPKPSVAFVEGLAQSVQPGTVSRFSIQTPSVQTSIPTHQVQPAVVSTYNIHQPAVAQPTVSSYTYEQDYSQGYHYPRPAIAFPQAVTYQKPAVTQYTYQDIAQQAVGIHQPSYVTPTTSRPSILVQNQPTLSTYTYSSPSTVLPDLVIQQQPAVSSDYRYTASSTVKPVEFSGYSYLKPSVAFEEEPRPVEEVPFVKKKAYLTGQVNTYQYNQPLVVENYQAPRAQSNGYFTSNVGTISSTPTNEQEYYSTPSYQVNQIYAQSTPRPTYQSTVAAVIKTQTQRVTEAPFYYYDSRLTSTQRPQAVQGYNYPKPKVVFEETPAPVVPTREYLPAVTSTTSRPVFKYSFSALDNNVYIPSTTQVPREYIPVTTKVQTATPQQVFVVPEISTTIRPVTPTTYLPPRPRVRVTTAIPSTQYLPVRPRVTVSTSAPVEVTTLARGYLPARSRVTSTISPIEVSSRRPAKVTIIKQNDFQPVLAAKLGAQCTCISDSLKTGKRKKIIIVEDDDDDDGYLVGNNNQGGVVLENYRYNPQNVVDITPTPQVYLQSTTNEIVPAPTPTYIRKRVRVRPLTSTSSYESATEVSDGEIAGAVRTGLKLVKQAAKEGAREGTEEAVAKYGNVNIRDTIECERAGLFRHPSQCNKFIACRWDCTKNKFTVHSFNCPIHLTFDSTLGACNWPSQGPACLENTLIPSE